MGTDSAKGEKGKDIWDVLGVLGTLTSTAILGGLTLLVSTRSDEVKSSIERTQNSIATASLVESLMKDLTSKNASQDIALIALNRQVGGTPGPVASNDANQAMVVEIAKTVFHDRLQTRRDDATFSAALDILKERSSHEYATAFKQLNDANAQKRAQIVSAPNSKMGEAKAPIVKATPFAAQYLSATYSAVVYIQYRLPSRSGVAEQLREALNKRKDISITAPEIEQVSGNYPSAVRFFHAEDSGVAQTIADDSNAFFKQLGLPIALETENFSPRNDVPRRQVEIWF